MDARYSIIRARPSDLGALPAIERAAAQLLAGHVPDSVLNETTDEHELTEAQAHGLLWVARWNDAPVGFALVDLLGSGRPHLEEVDVLPQHGQRGIGTALVRTVCQWAADSGHAEITLTTFRALPWNMPFYQRLGFQEISLDQLSPELIAIVEDEAARGLDFRRRAVMRYTCAPR